MIRIITDSTSDLSPQRREAIGVDVIPLSVQFGQEIFRDGVDITNAEFYDRLSKAEALPTTSQINPRSLPTCSGSTWTRGTRSWVFSSPGPCRAPARVPSSPGTWWTVRTVSTSWTPAPSPLPWACWWR